MDAKSAESERKARRAESERLRSQSAKSRAAESSARRSASACARHDRSRTDKKAQLDGLAPGVALQGMDVELPEEQESVTSPLRKRELTYSSALKLRQPSSSAQAAVLAAVAVGHLFPEFMLLATILFLVKALPAKEWVEVRMRSLAFLVRGNPSIIWCSLAVQPRQQVRWTAVPCTPTHCAAAHAHFYGAVAPSDQQPATGRAEVLPLLLPQELINGGRLRRFQNQQQLPAQPPELTVAATVALYEIVALGPDGRRVRDMGCSIGKAIRQAAGGFHVALRIGDHELTYCSFSGQDLQVLGAVPTSGVVRHKPGEPGRCYAFQQEERLGDVKVSDALQRAMEMGRDMSWARSSYSKLWRNCGNFVDALLLSLGLPSGSRGWTRCISQFTAAVPASSTHLAQAADATISILRQGLSAASTAVAVAPAEVLNEAAELLWQWGGSSADSSDDDETEPSADEMTIVRALGSLSIHE